MKRSTVYLTNKELLAEINLCKASFGSFLDPAFKSYDAIVHNLADVTPALLEDAAKAKSKATREPHGTVGLIIRLMTWDHVPLDAERKPKARSANRTHAHVTFPPYAHYLVTERGLTLVGRSHWQGDLETGHFTATKGRVTERMGRMFMLLVERYGRKANWRGYSYNADMQSLALVQLSQVGLQFDESKSSNPFAFYVSCITNIFRRMFNDEKKQQTIRDDLMWSAGAAPSDTRQTEWEMQRMGLTDLPPLVRKPGRPPKRLSA